MVGSIHNVSFRRLNGLGEAAQEWYEKLAAGVDDNDRPRRGKVASVLKGCISWGSGQSFAMMLAKM